jgi:putative ABC transport system permease protein
MTQDIRLAFRAIVRAPSYAALVIGSLAIGIAAPVLAFSVMNAIFFRPLDGVRDQDGLVRIAFQRGRATPRPGSGRPLVRNRESGR